MITVDQMAEILSRRSNELGMPMSAEKMREKLLDPNEEYGRFLAGFAQEMWQLGYDTGKPVKLTSVQKCTIFHNTHAKGRGIMHAIEDTERAIHENRPYVSQ